MRSVLARELIIKKEEDISLEEVDAKEEPNNIHSELLIKFEEEIEKTDTNIKTEDNYDSANNLSFEHIVPDQFPEDPIEPSLIIDEEEVVDITDNDPDSSIEPSIVDIVKVVPIDSILKRRPQPPRRGRGRPPRPYGRDIFPKVIQYKVRNAVNTKLRNVRNMGNVRDMVPNYPSMPVIRGDHLTEEEIGRLRYLRMRDLNNEASKRARDRKKGKLDLLETELAELFEENTRLNTRYLSIKRMAHILNNFLSKAGVIRSVKLDALTPDEALTLIEPLEKEGIEALLLCVENTVAAENSAAEELVTKKMEEMNSILFVDPLS